MKLEQDLVREPTEPLPEGVTAIKPAGRVSTVEGRRDVRIATDALILDGLRMNTLPPLVDGCCAAMLALARTLNRHWLEPEVPHFIEAASALIEDARTIFDAGMRVDDMDKAMVGAVMIEISVRGICAALSIPYEEALRAVHAGREPPIRVNSGEDDGRSAEQAVGGIGGPG